MLATLRVDQLLGLKRFAEAKDLALQELAQFPHDAVMHSKLASAQVGLRELGKALDSAETAISLQHSSGTYHADRAAILSKLGRHGEAAAGFDNAVSLAPDSLYVHVALVEGVYHDPKSRKKQHRAEQVARAERSVAVALELNPEHEASHIADALVHHLAGRPEATKRAAERALAINPNQPTAFQLLGLAQQGLGETRAAGDSYVAAGKLDPTSSSSGDLLENLGKAAAPIGLGLFALFRVLARAGSRGAESAGVPGEAILVCVILALGVFLAISKSNRREKPINALSPEARAAIKARQNSR